MKHEREFEKNLKRLEDIVHALDSQDLSLEDGLKLYKEGAQCSRFCREELEKAKHALEVWENGEARSLSPEECKGTKSEGEI